MLLLCQQLTAQDVGRMTIDLGGRWSFALDADGAGQAKGYTDRELPDSVTLPGTTDTNGKGYRNDNRSETTHLSRRYTYTGPAWYSRQHGCGRRRRKSWRCCLHPPCPWILS